MLKKNLIFLFAFSLIFIACNKQKEKTIESQNSANKLTPFVNPFIGTGGHGHTYPGATVPFGMIQLSPDNGISDWDWCSGYHISDNIIAGFSHLHLSGTGIGDLADLLFMPVNREINLTAEVKSREDIPYKSESIIKFFPVCIFISYVLLNINSYIIAKM
jgi:putative alpha-1,2-mannosidase